MGICEQPPQIGGLIGKSLNLAICWAVRISRVWSWLK